MSSDKNQRTEETEDKPAQLTTTRDQVETSEQLQAEIENLKLELRKAKSISSGKIGIMFMVPGALSLVFSIFYNSQVLAFIGLGLTFWGGLFLFVKPVGYVKSSLLDSAAISSYSTIDRIVKDLEYKGRSYYIPPYPKEVYLPEHLKGLKDMIVFISADNSGGMPSMEEMAKGRFLLEHPKGICVPPPGLGLLTQFEKELRIDITKIGLSELCESLPQLILENFQLVKEIEMKTEEDQVHLKIFDSVYKNLYSVEGNLKSVHFLGCPIVSAIACLIAKATGKIVTIHKDRVSPEGQTIEVWYGFVEG
jgi:TM2 domain-containing membrane protein YozV